MNTNMQNTNNNNNNSTLSCTECGVEFNATNLAMSRLCGVYTGKKRRRAPTLQYPFCVGCFRLFGGMKSTLQKYKMFLWLLSGEYDEEVGVGDSVRSLQVGRYTKLAQRMRQRAKDKSNVAPDSLKIATGSKLMGLMVNNDPNDAILGHRIFLVGDGSRFNGLSFNHILPVATIRDNPNAFSIDNIQLMSRCLNNVKDYFDDYQLNFWLDHLLAACSERYSSS